MKKRIIILGVFLGLLLGCSPQERALAENILRQVQDTYLVEAPVICIDAGHQAEENRGLEAIGPGAIEKKMKVSKGATGLVSQKKEYMLTLDLALKLQGALLDQGYRVVMTRVSHEVDLSNMERAEIANSQGADLFVRLHADQSSNLDMHGISVLCPDEASGYSGGIFKQSDTAAHVILEAMVASTNAENLGVSYRKDISGFNWSKCPVVLVELGFMSHKEEDLKLWEPGYQDLLVEGMVEGIKGYIKTQEE